MNALVYVNIDRGIRKIKKIKVSRNEKKRKNLKILKHFAVTFR